jgi:Fe2+ or Zn2+ uptake regulation protein
VNDSHTKPPDRLTEDLLDYWVRHPQAEATIEAIVEWWLLEQRIQQAAFEVESVLGTLVEQGFVVEHRQADGRIRYRLNREREAEIRGRLESGSGRRSSGGGRATGRETDE